MTLTNANLVNSEYLECRRYSDTEFEQGSESASSVPSKGRLRRFAYFGTLVKDNSIVYKYWNYISSVHIASISALMYSLFIVMIPWSYEAKMILRFVSAVLDAYFLIRIYVGAHLIYKDPESGVLIKDLKLIRRRYFCSVSRFWLDLITLFPFEYLLLLMTNDTSLTRFGYTPRILRCCFMYQYYKEQEENLNVRQHLRITYLLYRIVFSIEWASCIW